jgi:hypothetical protein
VRRSCEAERNRNSVGGEARNGKDSMVAPMVESGGSLYSGDRFCVGAFGRHLDSVIGKMFFYTTVTLKGNL